MAIPGAILARLAAAVLVTGVPPSAEAQGTGVTAGLLLELPATPRAMALGGAYTAVVGDEGSVFHNPAGLAPVRRLALGGSHERSFFDGTLSTAAGALRYRRFTLGLGVAYLDLGTDSVFEPDPNFGGDRGVFTGEMLTAYHALAAGSLTWRRGLLSVGATGKYLRESVSTPSSSSVTSGVAADVGLAVALFDIAALGMVVQNIGPTLKSRVSGSACTGPGCRPPLPRTTRLGFALNFVDPQGTMRLLTSLDWVSPPGGDNYVALGLEGGVVSRGTGALARMGWRAGGAPSDRSDLSFGGGLVLGGLRLDYAFQAWDVTGFESHRFGVRWVW